MNLNQLRYFIAVVEAGSTTEAAKALNVSQPAVTRGIHQLEAELGVSLFERLPRAMQLTSFGASYFRHAQLVFAQLKSAEAELAYMNQNPADEITIGAGPSWMHELLPEAVSRLAYAYPEIRLRVRGGYDTQLLAMLERGEIAFGLTETADDTRRMSFTQEPLIESSYVVAARAGHPLAGRAAISMEELLKFPWAMPDQAASAVDRLKGMYLAASLPEPAPRIYSTSLGFILDLLARSDFLSFVVKSSLKERTAESVISLDVAAPLPTRKAGIITRKGAWISPMEASFMSLLRDVCRESPQH